VYPLQPDGLHARTRYQNLPPAGFPEIAWDVPGTEYVVGQLTPSDDSARSYWSERPAPGVQLIV
jgi:hypothetical protein